MISRGLVVAAFVAAAPEIPAQAQDASFGCKVLLCAAAAAPGWSGIPYCVPVMQQLFSNLAKGGSWPVCAQANAGTPGYQPYQDCPTGTVAADQQASTNQGSVASSPLITYTADPNGGYCVAPSQLGATSQASATTRSLRADPYYVDISTASGTSRFWFSLNGQ